jgi:hypothetical protein
VGVFIGLMRAVELAEQGSSQAPPTVNPVLPDYVAKGVNFIIGFVGVLVLEEVGEVFDLELGGLAVFGSTRFQEHDAAFKGGFVDGDGVLACFGLL